MKKLFLFLILLSFIPKVNASTNTANSYILMDMDTGRVLKQKNMHSPMLIASITKIMTCILAIELKEVNDIVTVSDIVKKSYGSGIYISAGEEISLLDLLYGLMLRSGNDAALMISEYVAGSEEEFVKLMNQKAKEIGMKNTKFYNPSGLDTSTIGNISTCYDMALLTKYAMNNPIYQSIVKTKKHTVKTNLKTYIWYNKNKMLNYDYITGGKTGYTERARRTLVSTSTKDNANYVVVTIKDSDDWNTHKYLHEYAFKNYQNYKILDKSNYNISNDYYENLYIKNNVYLSLNKEELTAVTSKIELIKKENPQNNDLVGVNYIYLNNTLMHKENIYYQNKKDTIFDLIRKKLKLND